jgi:release factor glutamine methyltransferase
MADTARENISGFTFTVPPTVFNPRDYISSGLFADFIKTLELNGKNILDMGSGSGIVSIFAASKGAICTAVDINPVAVRCTAENAERNKLSDRIKAVESDLFTSFEHQNIPGGGFDIIFFNPPYYKGIPRNNFERAFKSGPGLEVIKDFIAGSKEYLAEKGVIYFILSSDMDLDEVESIFKSGGYTFNIVKKIKKLFETFYIIEAVL